MKLRDNLIVGGSTSINIINNAEISNLSALFEKEGIILKRTLGNIVNYNYDDLLNNINYNIPSIFTPGETISKNNPNVKFSMKSQPINTFLAAPSIGNGTPSFRRITAEDLADTGVLFSETDPFGVSSLEFTGTKTKTLTITLNNGSKKTANFDDANSTYPPGTLDLLKSGTDTLDRIWSSKAISDYVNLIFQEGASKDHTHTFASITSKPTTLSGYGITDGGISEVVSNIATGTTDVASTSNGSTFINFLQGGAVKGSVKIVGSGSTSVTHTTGGVITITGTDTNTTYTAGNGLTLSGTVFSLPVTDSGSGDYVTNVTDSANGLTVTKATLPIPSLITSTSATGVANVATTNTNTYLNIVRGGTSTGSSTQITGSGSVTVSSDASGKLTINGTNTTYTAGTLTVLNTGTATTQSTWTSAILNDWLNGKNFVTASIIDGLASQTWVSDNFISNTHVANGITTTNISNWNTAFTNNHTHSNKAILDATTASFTTALKTKLDGLSNYTLPTASASVLGGIKVGNNLSIDANGVLSATDTTPNDGTLTLSTGTGLSGSATFNANQSTNSTFTVGIASGYVLPTTAQTTSWDNKQNAITGGATTIVSSNLTANRALISNASGKVAVSPTTSTELSYLSGVTSSIQTQLNDKINSSLIGANNGVASLGSDGKINSNQLPALAITETFPVSTQAQMLALTAQQGDVAIRTDINKTFILRQEPASTLANWEEMLMPASGVQSVAMSVPTGFSISGSPITSTGTLALSYASGYQGFTTAQSTKLAGIATGANNYTLPIATATVLGGIELFSNTVQSVASNAVSTTASRTYGLQLNSAGQAVVNVPWSDTNTTYSAGTGLSLSGTTFSVKYGTTAGTSAQGNDSRIIAGYNYSQVGHLPLSGGTLTGDLDLMANNNDRFITFRYANDDRYAWRVGYLGSGAGNENYFVIQSAKETGTVYSNAIRIGLNDLKVDFATIPSVGGVDMVLTNDTRINNGQTAYDWGDHSGLYALVGRSIVAGNGLSGGGTLAANRTITLGTPTAIGLSTTNSVTSTSHTHALDSATTTAINNGQTAFGWGNFRDYGLGLEGGSTVDINDLDLADASGFFSHGSSPVNGAFPSNSGGFINFKSGISGSRNIQIEFIGNNLLEPRAAIRHQLSTGYTEWRELTHTGNLDSQATSLGFIKSSDLSGYVPTSRTLTAGNGLSGGGNLTANRTFTLGTPSAITLSSTNSVTTSSHTHAFTPGGTTAQYIRGDGSLATYVNTTYTAGTGLSLTGTTFGQAITTSGTGTFVTGITQTTNGFQINLGTPPNTVYSTDTLAILNAGTSTSGALQTAKNLNDWLNGKGFSTQTLSAGSGVSIVGSVISNSAPNIDQKLSISGMKITLDRSGGAVTVPSSNLVTSSTATGTTNVATTNTNTYLNIVEGGTTLGSSTQVTGSGSVTVSSDANGKLTITGVNTNTTYSAGNGLTLSGTTFSLPVTTSGSGNVVSAVAQSTNGITVTKGISAMTTSHAANGITSTNISNWNTAYGWGNHSGLYVNRSEYRNFGSVTINSADGTTDAFIEKLQAIGMFNYRHSVCKGSWNYAGNTDITDTGFGSIETAGAVIEVFYSKSTDYTIKLTCTNTGGDTPKRIFVYNNQGSSYSPGWREVVTSNTPSFINGQTAFGWGNHSGLYALVGRSIVAGNGLSGGGTLAANRTLTLGTPTAITLSSTNSVAASSHTHAFTPGGTTAQYIRGDGSLATYVNTTYTAGNGLTLTGTAFSLPITVSGSGNYVTNVVANANGLTVTKATLPTYAVGAIAELNAGTVATGRLWGSNVLNTWAKANFFGLDVSRTATDLNTARTSGVFAGGNVTNAPTGSYSYSPYVVMQSSSDRFVQMWYDSLGGNDIHFRNGSNTSWGAWRKLWHTGHFTQGDIDNWNSVVAEVDPRYSRKTFISTSIATTGILKVKIGRNAFSGWVRIRVTGSYSSQNVNGLIEISGGIGANVGSIWNNQMHCIESQGTTRDGFYIDPVIKVDTDNQLYFEVHKKSAANNSISVDIETRATGSISMSPSIEWASTGTVITNLTNEVTFQGSVTADKFIKTGGTSSQFLKANGSVDSNTYALASALSSYVPTSRTITAGNGLSGGGTLAANRTITLGTPTAITLSSTNSVAASSHTHAFTPGGTTAQYIRGDGSLATYVDTKYTAGTGLSLSGTTFGQTITTSGSGTFVTGITQTANGFQINLGTPPNTNTTYTGSNGIVVSGTVISPTYGTTSTTIARGDHKHTFLSGWADTRSVNTIPNDYNSKFEVKGIKQSSVVGLNNTTHGSYTSVIGYRGWNDASGGQAFELGFAGNGQLLYRSGDSTSWGAWKEIVHTGNLSAGNGLTLSGTTFSLPVTTSGSGNVVSAITQTANGISVSKGISAMTTSHPANGITSTNITNWNNAFTNRHSHSNISYLNSINQNLGKGNNVQFGSIELSAPIPYIDFHFGNSTADYTSRIIENSLGGLNLISTHSLKYNVNDVTTPFLEIDRYKAILGANVSNFEAVYLKTVFGSLNFDDEGLIYRPDSQYHSFGIESNVNAYYDIELYGKLNRLKINGRGSLGSPLDLLTGNKLTNYVFADVSNKDALGTFRVESNIIKDGIPVFARWGASILAQTGDTMFTLSANSNAPEIFVSAGNTTNNVLWNKKLAFSVNEFPLYAQAFYENSLRKLKENIKPFDKSGLELINSLDIVTFDRKDSEVKNKIGIIADDSVDEVLSNKKDAVDLYNTIFIQAKAIQELSDEVVKLKDINNSLEERLKKIEKLLNL